MFTLLITANFSQLTNTVLPLLAMVIACSGVNCGLKYKHWPMKQKLFLDQKGCQVAYCTHIIQKKVMLKNWRYPQISIFTATEWPTDVPLVVLG